MQHFWTEAQEEFLFAVSLGHTHETLSNFY